MSLRGDRFDNFVLASKIAVDRAGTQLRLFDNILHGSAVKTVPRKAPRSRVENLELASLPLCVADLRHPSTRGTNCGCNPVSLGARLCTAQGFAVAAGGVFR